MGLPLRSSVAKLSCEAATEENAKRRSFMPRTQVTGKANFSPGITSGLSVIRELAANGAQNGQFDEMATIRPSGSLPGLAITRADVFWVCRTAFAATPQLRANYVG